MNTGYMPGQMMPMMGQGFQSTFNNQASSSQQQSQIPVFDDAAFEAAFSQAKQEVEQQQQMETQQEQQDDMDISHYESIRKEATPDYVHEQIRIGSDTIPQTDQNEAVDKTKEADELARTAGELLDKLNTDSSQKFKESNFLELMRRIRDREVHVEGDDFREVSTQE